MFEVSRKLDASLGDIFQNDMAISTEMVDNEICMIDESINSTKRGSKTSTSLNLQ